MNTWLISFVERRIHIDNVMIFNFFQTTTPFSLFKKSRVDTAPNEYSWTNLYLMSILSLVEAGKRGASRLCPEGHFPKLNFILKVKRERV